MRYIIAILILLMANVAYADKFYIPLMCTPEEFKDNLTEKGLNTKWVNEVPDKDTFAFITPLGNQCVLHVLGEPTDKQLKTIQDAINDSGKEM